MERIKNMANQLENATDKTSALAAQIRLEFETMAELQRQEIKELNEQHAKERASIRQFFNKLLNKVILAFTLIILLFVGSVAGGVIWFFNNYDIAAYTYQDVMADNDSTSIIYDGISYTTK